MLGGDILSKCKEKRRNDALFQRFVSLSVYLGGSPP